MGTLGGIRGVDADDRQGFFEAIFDVFTEVLSLPDEGTLVVPTFTHEYARNGVSYIHEESPSETGAFSEHIRKKETSVRSLHPINSFSAIGKLKHAICDDLGKACYGHDSVFERLIERDARMVFFGASMRHMTLKHHLEHVVGLPYVYHKAYFTPVYKDGEKVGLPFLACVRYLNGKVENNDCSEFEERLRGEGMLGESRVGGAKIIRVAMRDAFDEACRALRENPCYFLEQPYCETR
jgi:aminoglycoside 3-N-acetyltransferase